VAEVVWSSAEDAEDESCQATCKRQCQASGGFAPAVRGVAPQDVATKRVFPRGEAPDLAPPKASDASPCPKVGARAWLTQRTLHHITDASLPLLCDGFKQMKVPVMEGTRRGFRYELSNFEIVEMDIASAKLDLVAGQGLRADLSGLTFQVWVDYHIDGEDWYNPVRNSGQLNVHVRPRSSAAALLAIGVSPSGRPHIGSISDVEATLDMSMAIYGTMLRPLVNTALWLFQRPIERMIANAIRRQLQDFFAGDMNNYLSLLDLRVPLQVAAPADQPLAQKALSFLEVDLRLCGAKVEEDAVQLDVYGAMVDAEDPKATMPGEPGAMPDELPGGKGGPHMMALALGDWQANSAMHILRSKGFLRRRITQEDLPEDMPFKLSTNTFRPFVPAWWLMEAKPMRVEVSASEDPTVALKPGNVILLTSHVSFKMYTVGHGGDEKYAFTVSARLEGQASARVIGGGDAPYRVQVAVASLEVFDLGVPKSDVGIVTVGLLAPVLGALVNQVAVPKANEFLASGVEVPDNFNDQLGVKWNGLGLEVEGATVVGSADFAVNASGLIHGLFSPRARAMARGRGSRPRAAAPPAHVAQEQELIAKVAIPAGLEVAAAAAPVAQPGAALPVVATAVSGFAAGCLLTVAVMLRCAGGVRGRQGPLASWGLEHCEAGCVAVE